jgi:hypothetical protein
MSNFSKGDSVLITSGPYTSLIGSIGIISKTKEDLLDYSFDYVVDTDIGYDKTMHFLFYETELSKLLTQGV